MIEKPFPINISIKDYNFSNSWYDDLILSSHDIMDEKNLGYEPRGNTNGFTKIFSTENLTKYPVIRDLFEIFYEGIYELASSYSNSYIDTQKLKDRILTGYGNMPSHRKNETTHIPFPHFHQLSTCFVVFYLDDVEKNSGGELVLHDPTYNNFTEFVCPEKFFITPKRGRLLVAPSLIRHNTTWYTGNNERRMILFDLQQSNISSNPDMLENPNWEGTVY